MPYITKFPLQFSADQSTIITQNPADQFETFFRVPISTRLIDPNYGIDEDMFLQRNIYSINEIAYLYYLNIREKFKKYIKNIYISRLKAEYVRAELSVYLYIYYVINSEEKFLKFKIADV